MKHKKAAAPASAETESKGHTPVLLGNGNGAQATSTANNLQPGTALIPYEAAATKAESNYKIPWDEAITKGLALYKDRNSVERRVQMELGKLADQVETSYGKKSIAKFAKALKE